MCILKSRMAGWDRPEVDIVECTVKCSPDEEPWAVHQEMAKGEGNVGIRGV